MKQITGIFHFTEVFKTYPQDEATVKLTIDYQGKTFSITPPWGKEQFSFTHTSKDYKKWLAVLNCIQKAIEFANEEIGVTTKHSPANQ